MSKHSWTDLLLVVPLTFILSSCGDEPHIAVNKSGHKLLSMLDDYSRNKILTFNPNEVPTQDPASSAPLYPLPINDQSVKEVPTPFGLLGFFAFYYWAKKLRWRIKQAQALPPPKEP